MQIKDLTTDELKALIRQTVIETLAELWGDPDQELQDFVKQQLIPSHGSRQTGEHGAPVTEIAEPRAIAASESKSTAKPIGLVASLIGMAKTDAPPPTDAEIQAMLDQRLVEKYL